VPGRPKLTPDDLHRLLEELRSKLNAEDRGLDLLLTTDSDKEAKDWQKQLVGEGLGKFEAERTAT
jgi:hypothetical protein